MAARIAWVVEESLSRLVVPVEKYGTLADALLVIADARRYQVDVAWRGAQAVDAGDRPTEEWIVLLNHYVTKLNAVYTESDGETVAGRARMTKYAGIVANLALWLVQATVGLSIKDKIAAGEGADAGG